MGLIGQVGHGDVQAAVSSIITSCIKHGVPVGAFAGDVRSARALLECGCTLIALGADALFLWRSAQQALRDLKSPPA
jgi:2-dehydro-3-deoxyglucarate aldolase